MSPLFFCLYALTASFACSDPLGSLEIVSETHAAVTCDAGTSLCEESTVSRVTTYNTLSTTRLFEMTEIHNRCEVHVFAFFFTSRIFSYFLLTFVACQAVNFFNSSHSLSTAAFTSRIFSACGVELNLCTKLYCASIHDPIGYVSVVLPALPFLCAIPLCFNSWCLVIVETQGTVRTLIITKLAHGN